MAGSQAGGIELRAIRGPPEDTANPNACSQIHSGPVSDASKHIDVESEVAVNNGHEDALTQSQGIAAASARSSTPTPRISDEDRRNFAREASSRDQDDVAKSNIGHASSEQRTTGAAARTIAWRRSIQSIYSGASASGRPSSVSSLPLQRVTSHGRESVLEMDLADTALEAMSAADMANPSVADRQRRRRKTSKAPDSNYGPHTPGQALQTPTSR